jgi:LAGLIDADG DNA endonuclease family/Cytochrome C oxidase subunit II, transmembrane domain
MILKFFSLLFLSIIYCDVPQPWQLYFQDGASPSFDGIQALHDQIIFYLVIILIGVSWMLISIIFNFNYKKNPIVYKYATHSSFIELVWTILPALILIAIAFPSFRLLYLMDNPIINLDFCHLALIPMKKLNSSCTALVPQKVGLVNRLYSTKPRKRLTAIQINSFTVTPHLNHILIGTLLGDCYIQRQAINSRLQFKQGTIHEAYILHEYDLLKDYCGSGLFYSNHKSDKKTGKINSSIRFVTYSLPCFNYYYDLFYENKVKRIPLNIGDLLTNVGLAYWAMDDGVKHGPGFSLCTDSYTFSEVQLLIKVLKDNFDLNCSIHNRGKDQFRIYIKSDSINKFRSLVTPHFHKSMMYKLTDKGQ